MGSDLVNLGIVPRKTYLKTWVSLKDPYLQNAFIRGYFDGDGHIGGKFSINNLSSLRLSIAGYEHNLKYF